MLSQLDRLSVKADGRYATDAELAFFQQYLKTARLRFGLYQKLQRLESQIVQDVLSELKRKDPTLLMSGKTDMTAKWQRDTIRVLRHAAAAVLIDDEESFSEGMLQWFETIMRSFGAERSCRETYAAMQTVTRQHLTQEEAELFLPILELSRSMFTQVS